MGCYNDKSYILLGKIKSEVEKSADVSGEFAKKH